MAKKKKVNSTNKPSRSPSTPGTPSDSAPPGLTREDVHSNGGDESNAEIVVDSIESEFVVESPHAEAPQTPAANNDKHVSSDHPSSETIHTPDHAPESEESVPLSSRYESVLAQIVAEKRNYDFFVNRVTRRLAEVTGGKNRALNELTELTSSVSALLKEIATIEANPSRSGVVAPVSVAGIRGPPLPSQDELFLKAWDQGQVGNTYSGFSQRKQYSVWKSSY